MRAISVSFMIGILVFLMTQSPSVEALSGDVTYTTLWSSYYGSCGLDISKQNPFYVAALSFNNMQLPPGVTNPNLHPLCGANHCLRIDGVRGSIVVKISDTCDDCKGDDVTLADTVYKYLDDPKKGRVRMNLRWVDCRYNPPGKIKS